MAGWLAAGAGWRNELCQEQYQQAACSELKIMIQGPVQSFQLQGLDWSGTAEIRSCCCIKELQPP
jgi:hypothetical protein